MNVLITGANGQLGWELQRTAPDGWKITALGHAELDITDEATVVHTVQEIKPDLVINTAAYTAVDKAEEENNKAFAVNSQGAANISKACAKTNARLILISTDFIFDGLQSSPYQPHDSTNPLGVYGASKLEGEQQVATILPDALIIRTGWLYSVNGHNFVKTMLKLMKNQEKLSVVADQVGTPTWAKKLAGVIWDLSAKPEIKGILHWTDAGIASWYDFAVAIQEEAIEAGIIVKAIPIQPIKTADYLTLAKRPPYSVLDKTKTWDALSYKADHWRVNLREMLLELGELNNA